MIAVPLNVITLAEYFSEKAPIHIMPSDHLTEQLLDFAREIGFDPVGVCRAEPAATFTAFESWLDEIQREGTCGGLGYLARHRNARRHPASVLPDVKSLIVVGLGYSAVQTSLCRLERCPTPMDGFGVVAGYACGLDYHDVMRAKLRQLAGMHRTLFPDEKTRIAVDTAPLLEREYAVRAGLGCIGKNTMLINERHGSRFFLGLLLTTADLGEAPCARSFSLNYDSPESHSICGTCRSCVDACPTGALATPYRLDPRKCINYWSIEHLGDDIPREIAAKFGNHLFGCETCQSVCPCNQNAIPCEVPPCLPDDLASCSLREQLETGVMSLEQINSLDEAEFQRQFAGTPLMRLGLARLKRNAAIVLENARISGGR